MYDRVIYIITYLKKNDYNDKKDPYSHRSAIIKRNPTANNWSQQQQYQSHCKTNEAPLLKICNIFSKRTKISTKSITKNHHEKRQQKNNPPIPHLPKFLRWNKLTFFKSNRNRIQYFSIDLHINISSFKRWHNSIPNPFL